MDKVLWSSNSDEWATPQEIFDELDDEFAFTLDPCSTDENHKCSTYFTIEDDGLKQSWAGHRVFCNPPYSKIAAWVQKAYSESLNPDTLVCLLVPARTDTKWFQNYCLHRSEVRFLRGRLKFGDAKTGAPFPSMVVIFRAGGMGDIQKYIGRTIPKIFSMLGRTMHENVSVTDNLYQSDDEFKVSVFKKIITYLLHNVSKSIKKKKEEN